MRNTRSLRNVFCWRSNLSNDDIIPQRPGLKTGVKTFILWSETGSGFREPAAHSHHEFPGRSTPLPWVSTPTPTTHPTKQSNLMGKITLLNIQAKNVLISYQIILQIFLFIHFRSAIVTLHPCILCLSLTSLRTSLSKTSISWYLRQFQRLCFYFTVILDSFSLSKRSPWLNKLKILYIHVSNILGPSRSCRVNNNNNKTN